MSSDSSESSLPVTSRLGSLIFLAALVVALVVAVQLLSPPLQPTVRTAQTSFDKDLVRQQMQPDRVFALADALGQNGSRLLGSPGHTASAARIREILSGAGYETFVRRNRVVAPVIQRNEILLDGVALPSVTLHPFQPNYYQPTATPPEGLTGKLLLLDDETLNRRTSFDGIIGVVDLRAIPKSYGLQWTRYAQLGIAGLILTAPPDYVFDWTDLATRNTMVSSLPVNFLRAYAQGDLLAHAGKEVTVHLVQRYQPVENLTIVGRLVTGQSAREALVLTAAYDAYGVLPTLANEPLQALSPATTLALALSLAKASEPMQRDIVVAFDGSQMMGGIGESQLISVIGNHRDHAGNSFSDQVRHHESVLAQLAEIEKLLESPEIFQNPDFWQSKINALSLENRAFLNAQVRYVLQRRVFEQGETLLQSKMALDRLKSGVSDDEVYQTFQKHIAEVQVYKGASSVSLERLIDRSHRVLHNDGLRSLLMARFSELRSHHEFELTRARTDDLIRQAMQGYDSLFVLNPRLLPTASPRPRTQVAFMQGEPMTAGVTAASRQESLFSTLVSETRQSGDWNDRLQIAPVRQSLFNQQQSQIGKLPTSLLSWNRFAHPAFMMVQLDRLESYRALAVPPPAGGSNLSEGMGDGLEFLGQVVHSIAHGAMLIRPPEHPVSRNFSGVVLASGVGQSVVPSFPLENTLVGVTAPEDMLRENAGFLRYPFLMTDVYGRYELLNTPAEFMVGAVEGYTPQAFWFDHDGIARWSKDATGSKIFKSERLPAQRTDFRDLNLVVFRSAPVSFLDMTNPQSLQPFASAGLISREGLSPFINSNAFATGDGSSIYVGPDRYFYALMRAGLPDNPLVQSVRGFLLGPADADSEIRSGGIQGDGYFAADHALFPDIALPMASSMLRLNQTRADLQRSRHLLDPGTDAFIQRSADLLEEAEMPGLPRVDAVLKARASAAYSAIVHPILRANINGAVFSILWYLGLLVPFVFFMERLIFGFADIRKQLAAQAIIFLMVFGLLRLMHPAFDMIRSAVMILLGFVILLIAGGVTVIFAGKFRENMAALEALRGKATGASVNTMGIVATAFLLGLNNMHRRKVRTGLTCGTLVLITFAMIAFTSVQYDVVESITPVGPASYQGLLVQNDEGRYVSPSEVFALDMRFGRSFPVEARSYLTGSRNNWTREIRIPSLEIRTTQENGARRANLASVLQFGSKEPLRTQIPLLTKEFWFQESDVDSDPKVIVSDRIATDLGIDVDVVNRTGGVPVNLNGAKFLVAGIFDSDALDRLRDLNGQSLLPPDIAAIPNARTDPQGAPYANPDDPRIPAADVVIIESGDLGFTVPNGMHRISSVAVGMEGLSLREARETILQYLEQTGSTQFFGIDGVAAIGKKSRTSSLQGLPDLVMPLIIAALTVLNTMKGSVYERRDEIYVYNAVGVAPRYVFFMFFAEAFVYSVVGAVLGYLLAQGTGFVLTAMDWTGGLNMTYAGANTIFASLAVMAAVFISTIFPARTAMQIAAPSQESGWSLPDPTDDTISFHLPFTFNAFDRIAVLAFFNRFLVDHGEGGSGRFRAGIPELDLIGDHENPEPQIGSMIWLKPYDLGVSQDLRISLPEDQETGEFISLIEIRRVSGTRESWVRLNRSLMAQIRQQFLHWRAVTPAQKEEFHREAMALFEAAVKREEDHV